MVVLMTRATHANFPENKINPKMVGGTGSPFQLALAALVTWNRRAETCATLVLVAFILCLASWA